MAFPYSDTGRYESSVKRRCLLMFIPIPIVKPGVICVSPAYSGCNELRRQKFQMKNTSDGKETSRAAKPVVLISSVICSGDWTDALSPSWRWDQHGNGSGIARVCAYVRANTGVWCVRCVHIGRLRHPRYSCSSPSPRRASWEPLSLGTCERASERESKNTLIVSCSTSSAHRMTSTILRWLLRTHTSRTGVVSYPGYAHIILLREINANLSDFWSAARRRMLIESPMTIVPFFQCNFL